MANLDSFDVGGVILHVFFTYEIEEGICKNNDIFCFLKVCLVHGGTENMHS